MGACSSYRAFGLCLAARSIYTIRLVPTLAERLSISRGAVFVCSFASSRIAPGSCSAQLNVAPCEMALRSSGRNRYPDSSPIFRSFFGKSFSSAAWQIDEFGSVDRCGYPDTSGQPDFASTGRRGVCSAPSVNRLVSYRLSRTLRSAAWYACW